MFQLRYYSPDFYKSVHQRILELLGQVQSVHQIPHGIFDLRRLPSADPNINRVDESHEKEIYERHFRPRASVLRQRLGQSIRKLLRSNSGGYFLGGTIAVTRNEQAEWFTGHAIPFKEYDKDPEVGFLKAVLEQGPALLDWLTPLIERGQPELEILDTFIGSHTLLGKFEREVKVGKKIFKTERGTFDWRKSIDAVCNTHDETWILEAKTRLNYEALGEVLTYALLYSDDHPEQQVRRGIICGTLDEDILTACSFYGVQVFQVTGKTIEACHA